MREKSLARLPFSKRGSEQSSTGCSLPRQPRRTGAASNDNGFKGLAWRPAGESARGKTKAEAAKNLEHPLFLPATKRWPLRSIWK